MPESAGRKPDASTAERLFSNYQSITRTCAGFDEPACRAMGVVNYSFPSTSEMLLRSRSAW